MSDPTLRNVANLTQSFRGIPPEKFKDKLARSVAGVLLAAAGFGVLWAFNVGILGKSPWLERVGIAAVAVGFLTASFEFVAAPLRYAVALAKDIAAIAISVLTRKKEGEP